VPDHAYLIDSALAHFSTLPAVSRRATIPSALNVSARVCYGRNIFWCEDEAAVARGLPICAEPGGWTVDLARSAEDALVLVQARAPGPGDSRRALPGMSGFDLCRELRRTMTMPSLMLTARTEEIDKVLGLETRGRRLCDQAVQSARIDLTGTGPTAAGVRRLALDGEPRQPSCIAGPLRIDLERRRVYKSDRPGGPHGDRIRVAGLSSAAPWSGVHTRRPAPSVWDYDNFVGDEKTVNVHIRHLREKIEEHPEEPSHILTVRGVGYKFAQ